MTLSLPDPGAALLLAAPQGQSLGCPSCVPAHRGHWYPATGWLSKRTPPANLTPGRRGAGLSHLVCNRPIRRATCRVFQERCVTVWAGEDGDRCPTSAWRSGACQGRPPETPASPWSPQPPRSAPPTPPRHSPTMPRGCRPLDGQRASAETWKARLPGYPHGSSSICKTGSHVSPGT